MSSFDKVPTALWMIQPQSVRNLLAKEFELSRTGYSEVRDQDLISDGFTASDLEGITSEKMEAYVGSHETFSRLWELTVMKAYSELNPPMGIIKHTVSVEDAELSEPDIEHVEKKYRKYTRKEKSQV